MVELELDRALLARLAAYCERISVHRARSNHWEHFARLNRIDIDPARGIARVNGGAGFDSDYELNFRSRTFREVAGKALRRAMQRDPAPLFSAAYAELADDAGELTLQQARTALAGELTPHKLLACHYANLILPHVPFAEPPRYLEIGPGAAYLAALMHAVRGGPLVLIDLPELIPFSVLVLNRAFPAAAIVLPHEASAGKLAAEDSAFTFLTPDQLDVVPDAWADIAVNTASFGEMLPPDVRRYFEFLRRAIAPRGLFFTANRVEKWMNAPGVELARNRPGEGTAIRFHEFPWSPHDEDVFYRLSEFHARVQPQNPMFMRLTRLARY